MAEIETPQGLIVGLIVPDAEKEEAPETPKKRGPKKQTAEK